MEFGTLFFIIGLIAWADGSPDTGAAFLAIAYLCKPSYDYLNRYVFRRRGGR